MKPLHLDRRKYIGGSDIASILNIQPPKWRTGYQTWLRKTREHDDSPAEQEKRAKREMSRGQILEPFVAKMLEVRFGFEVPVRNQRMQDPDVDYFAAEIDAELGPSSLMHAGNRDLGSGNAVDAILAAGLGPNDVVNVEIKTVSPWRIDEWGGEEGDEIPLHYQAQVMWGLGVTRRRFALCAALFGADDLRLYPVIADAETIAAMRKRADAWWNDYVVPKVAPPPSSAADTLAMWPADSGLAKDADATTIGAVRALAAIRDKVSTYTKGAEGVDLLIREFMTTASELVDPATGATIATLKAQPTQSVDVAKLKAEFPEVYKAVARKGTTRVLRLKE